MKLLPRGRLARLLLPGRSTGPLLAFLATLALLGAPEANGQTATDATGKVRTDSIWVKNIEGDSLWVDSLTGDSLRKAVVEDSLSKIPSVTIDNVPTGFHPVYNVQGNYIRASTNVTNTFTLDYLLRHDLVAKTKTSWEKRRADRANRESGIQHTEAELQHLLFSNLRVGMKYARDNNTERDDLRSTDIVLNRLVFQSTFIQNLADPLRFTLSAEAGLENRDKDDDVRATGTTGASSRWEKKRGNAYTSSAGLQYTPKGTVDVSMDATVTRNSFSIETGGGAAESNLSEDNRDATNNVGGRVRYEEFPFAKLNLAVMNEQANKTFVRPAGGIETATDRRRNATLSLKGIVTERTEYDVRLDYAFGKRRFAIDANQSSERLDYGAEVSILNKLPASIKSKLTLKRDASEDTYHPKAGDPDASGRTERGSVFLSLQRALWNYSQLRVSGNLDLTARVLADSTQDRDNRSQRLNLDLDFTPPGKLKGSASFSVDEGRTVNIDGVRSGSNETRQTWRVSPTIDYNPLPNVRLSSAYTMTLIYIFKEANSSRNTMTRVSELRSVIDWGISDAARFGLEYRYKLDESGSFRKDGSTRRFARNREGETQNLSLKISYKIGQSITLETGQYVQVEKQYTLEEEKNLDSERDKTQIYSQVMFRRDLSKRASLNLKARQIQDATVPVFPLSGTGDDRKTEWELNGGLTFKL